MTTQYEAVQLAGFSIAAFVLSGASSLWFSVLIGHMDWPLPVSLMAVNLVVVMSVGSSVLPRNSTVWHFACLLGMWCTSGVLIIIYNEVARALGFYFVVMSVFHFGEYVATALTNPNNLSDNSFLLNHSIDYWLAACISWIEFGLELWLWPELKSMTPICWLGLLLCIAGDVLRKLAMWHCGKNFSHVIQSVKQPNHTLVTGGVFGYFRHPSYVGWFYWSIGTQLILSNPLCVILYAIVSWRFFADRIYVEEIMLLNFFGSQYEEYQAKVATGLPWIRGFSGQAKQRHRD